MSNHAMPIHGFVAEREQIKKQTSQISHDSRLAKAPGTCTSRSTSAGSATPRKSSVGEETDRSPILSLAEALGDSFEHADKTPFVVRNTFIDAPIGRSLSLDGFLNERAIRSCPTSRPASIDEIGGPPGLTAGRQGSFDEVVVRPSLEELCSPIVDKSIHVMNHAEHDPFFVIRNTFIDTVIQRPLSLEGFLQSRETQSCPASRPTSMDDMELPPGLESLLEVINEGCPPTPPARATNIGEQQQAAIGDTSPPCWGSYDTRVVGLSSAPPPPMTWAPVVPQSVVPPHPPPSYYPGGSILHLSQLLSEPEVGSSFLPSDGSVGHHTGDCKPCAFFHTKGCGNGSRCSFCHICGPDEKRRRRVEKRQHKRLFQHSGASCNAYQPEL